MTWEAVATISSAVSAAVVVVAAWYTHMQLRESKRARSAQVLLEFRRLHTSARSQETRDRLQAGEFADPAKLTNADRRLLEDVVDEQELLALLAHHGLLEREVAQDFFRYSPQQVWSAAQPFILAVRRDHPGYGTFLEKYVEGRGHLAKTSGRPSD